MALVVGRVGWLPWRILCSTRGYCTVRYCSRSTQYPTTVQYPTSIGYCTVPAVPAGTAVLQVGTAVLHSTEHVLRYCSSGGYCTVPSPVLCSTQKKIGLPDIFLKNPTERPRDRTCSCRYAWRCNDHHTTTACVYRHDENRPIYPLIMAPVLQNTGFGPLLPWR